MTAVGALLPGNSPIGVAAKGLNGASSPLDWPSWYLSPRQAAMSRAKAFPDSNADWIEAPVSQSPAIPTRPSAS